MTTKPLHDLLFPYIDELRHAPSDERAMELLLDVVEAERDACVEAIRGLSKGFVGRDYDVAETVLDNARYAIDARSKPAVCRCHTDGWDVDGLTCPSHDKDDPDAGCNEYPVNRGPRLACRHCVWKGFM